MRNAYATRCETRARNSKPQSNARAICDKAVDFGFAALTPNGRRI
jgi:hypothetical protein